jgi:nitric oxide reductase NorE protein
LSQIADVDNVTDSAPVQRDRRDHTVWILVLADLVMFGSFFIVFALYRNKDMAQFAIDQKELSRGIGTVNTLILVTSSLFMVIAVRRARAGAQSSRWITAAAVCGAAFAVIKIGEYLDKAAHGIWMDSSMFFQLYFGFTATHLSHVLCGVGVLLVARRAGRRVAAGRAQEGDLVVIEHTAVYWHLVDLLWLILFPLLYLS